MAWRLALSVLLNARDSGLASAEYLGERRTAEHSFTEASAAFGSSCTGSTSLYSPGFGVNLSMGGPTTWIPRPAQTMLAMLNNAIGTNYYVLSTSQTGTPTYNQAAAQPDPNQSSLTDSIAANSQVPYIQAAAFGDGAGHYSLVALCLQTTSCPITFHRRSSTNWFCNYLIFN
jgi:hypothetical protein